MRLLLYYAPLVALSIVMSLRIYFSCFGSFASANSCVSSSSTAPTPSATASVFDSSISFVRRYATSLTHKYFPSPHSELLLGMTIGINDLSKVPYFEQNLRTTGTIHVVVVSGFNINLVFSLVIGILGSRFKFRNVIIAEIISLLYSLLTGFQPPVIRAWLMSSIFAFGRYSGRLIDGFRILLFTGIIMVIYQPAYLFSLSFQLSFCATLGLIMFSTSFNHFFHSEDLSATLAAQVMVWPLISRTFGTFSIASFIINPLILWSVPISTMLGGVFILFGWVHPVVASTIAILLYPFLDIFVRAVNFFSSIKLASVSLSIAPLALIIYYTMTFAVWLKFVPKEG